MDPTDEPYIPTAAGRSILLACLAGGFVEVETAPSGRWAKAWTCNDGREPMRRNTGAAHALVHHGLLKEPWEMGGRLRTMLTSEGEDLLRGRGPTMPEAMSYVPTRELYAVLNAAIGVGVARGNGAMDDALADLDHALEAMPTEILRQCERIQE